ncbi:MAG TPA: YdiU family protein [Oceanospirillaceae bacterium]|nr:YdiU family protein [Oceanospirillaceae bacterium]
MTTVNSPTFETTYTQLPEHFYSFAEPTPVPQAKPFALNLVLAKELGINTAWLSSEAAAQALAGNAILDGSKPLAQAYAGHQFGSYNPQLGDGRAHLLGEIVAPNGERFDLQLKGSGPTPYSRRGDGRSPLGPVLREYLISEAMAALKVPTTRSLAAVATGQKVLRKGAEPGAVLTRIAPSHIRIGTFEYFAMQGDQDAVKQLADYCLQRHFPALTHAEQPYLALLNEVIKRQAKLIAQWQGFGFIHGVMNTDNMLICGATVDYGPCAFMDQFDPDKVFSAIDRQGRYRYNQQAGIGQWNLVRLAQALLPLLHPNGEQALVCAQQALDDYVAHYGSAYQRVMSNKLGLSEPQAEDQALTEQLLAIMAEHQLDFTLCFRSLVDQVATNPAHQSIDDVFAAPDELLLWQQQWLQRLANDPQEPEQRYQQMNSANPAFIARNHQVEMAIRAAEDQQDFAPFEALLKVVQSPWEYQSQLRPYALAPTATQAVKNTFCGT